MRRREDDAGGGGGGNGDGEWRWWWHRTLSSVAVYVAVHVCVYRDSSLKIQMEYRAFEERSARGGGARMEALRVGQGRSMGWGRYFKNRILIRAANPTLCNPYVCVGLTYPLGAPSVCALSFFLVPSTYASLCVSHLFTSVWYKARNLKLNVAPRHMDFSLRF